MYRFLLRPKWIVFHVAIVAAIGGMLWAAQWQFGKYQARNDFKDQVSAREAAEPRELAPLLADGATDSDLEWYRVTAAGEYVQPRQLRVINVSQNGVVGANVLTPFQIDGGPLVLVNRGFIADGEAVPAAPQGHLVIGGSARTSRQRRAGELSDNGDAGNDEIRRIDLAVAQQRLGSTLAPVYIDLIASEPAQDTTLAPIPRPDLDGGPPHLSYTFQWVIFSLCAVGGWVFAVRKSARTQHQPSAASPPDPR